MNEPKDAFATTACAPNRSPRSTHGSAAIAPTSSGSSTPSAACSTPCPTSVRARLALRRRDGDPCYRLHRHPGSTDDRHPRRTRLSARAREGLARAHRTPIDGALGDATGGVLAARRHAVQALREAEPQLARVHRVRVARGARALPAPVYLGRRRERPADAAHIHARATSRRHAPHRGARRVPGPPWVRPPAPDHAPRLAEN